MKTIYNPFEQLFFWGTLTYITLFSNWLSSYKFDTFYLHRLCLGAWSDHGERTGGFYACNRYEAAKQEGVVRDTYWTNFSWFWFLATVSSLFCSHLFG